MVVAKVFSLFILFLKYLSKLYRKKIRYNLNKSNHTINSITMINNGVVGKEINLKIIDD